MIKLTASYGLKVPAEQEYSSQSFHATAEIELADSLVNKPDALKAALHSLWGDLKTAVAAEIRGVAPQPTSGADGGNGRTSIQTGGNQPTLPARERQDAEPVQRHGSNGNGQPASKKQVGFLLSLARRHRNLSADGFRTWLRKERGLELDRLSKSAAATMIDELQPK